MAIEYRLMNVEEMEQIVYSTRSSHPIEEVYLWIALSDIYKDFNKTRPFAIHRDVPPGMVSPQSKS